MEIDAATPTSVHGFRRALAEWLDANLTPEVVEAGREGIEGPEALEVLRSWNRMLADAGWAAVAWPSRVRRPRRHRRRAVGLSRGDGRGRGPRAGQRHRGGQHRAGHPRVRHPGPEGSVHPTAAARGRDLVPGHVRARRRAPIWGRCAPRPRSTATSSSSTGRRRGTASATTPTGASSTFAPTRPRPSTAGISCLLVDMRTPGIEVRPLRTMTGEVTFSEIFFSDVRVPTTSLLGPLNEGWKVAMTTLSYERAGVAKFHLSLSARFADAGGGDPAYGHGGDPGRPRSAGPSLQHASPACGGPPPGS